LAKNYEVICDLNAPEKIMEIERIQELVKTVRKHLNLESGNQPNTLYWLSVGPEEKTKNTGKKTVQGDKYEEREVQYIESDTKGPGKENTGTQNEHTMSVD